MSQRMTMDEVLKEYGVPQLRLDVHATRTPLAGGAAFVFALFLAWNGASLFRCAAGASIMVFVVEGLVIGF